MSQDGVAILSAVEKLVYSWCDKHNLEALRHILNGYPLTSPLTDGWALLEESLQDVRNLGIAKLSIQEERGVGRLIVTIQRMLDDR
jgi:hypothetical protein